MAITLEALEVRLTALEREMTRLRELVTPCPGTETSAQRGARLLAQTRREKPRLKAAAEQVFTRMGITQAPVPPEQVRALMAACGVRPEDKLFSRGIQEMREE